MKEDFLDMLYRVSDNIPVMTSQESKMISEQDAKKLVDAKKTRQSVPRIPTKKA